MEEGERLDILINGFRRLDEGQKDFIRDLTRALAAIHCGGELAHRVNGAVSPYKRLSRRAREGCPAVP